MTNTIISLTEYRKKVLARIQVDAMLAEIRKSPTKEKILSPSEARSLLVSMKTSAPQLSR